MEHLGFTWFDLVALAVVALSGIMAFARGLIREVFSVFAFFGGAAAAWFFPGLLRPVVEAATSLRGGMALFAGGLVNFLIVFIIVTVITSLVAKNAHQSTEIGSFDRATGLAFGILRGVLVISLFVLLMRQTTGDPRISPQASMPEAFSSGRTYPIYESVAKALERFLPQARDRAHDIIQRDRQTESSATTEAAHDAAPAEGSQQH